MSVIVKKYKNSRNKPIRSIPSNFIKSEWNKLSKMLLVVLLHGELY